MTTGATLQILVADDHPSVRRGIRALLTTVPDWIVCGEARTGREAIRLALHLKPDVVILDLEMPDQSGLDATREIKRALPQTEILIFTMHHEEQLIVESLKAGAKGYLLKTDFDEKLIDGVKALANHKPFLGAKIPEALADRLSKTPARDEAMFLTRRQREIVRLLSEGNSNKQIAAHLSVSIKTIEAHRAAIMRKLGFKSITELVRFAIRNKLVNP